MSNHTFSATFQGPAHATVTKAQAAIEKAGGTFTGDDSKGGFSASTPAGTVKGQYTIEGQNFSVTITDKPFIVPGSTIESKIREYLT